MTTTKRHWHDTRSHKPLKKISVELSFRSFLLYNPIAVPALTFDGFFQQIKMLFYVLRVCTILNPLALSPPLVVHSHNLLLIFSRLRLRLSSIIMGGDVSLPNQQHFSLSLENNESHSLDSRYDNGPLLIRLLLLLLTTSALWLAPSPPPVPTIINSRQPIPFICFYLLCTHQVPTPAEWRMRAFDWFNYIPLCAIDIWI